MLVEEVSDVASCIMGGKKVIMRLCESRAEERERREMLSLYKECHCNFTFNFKMPLCWADWPTASVTAKRVAQSETIQLQSIVLTNHKAAEQPHGQLNPKQDQSVSVSPRGMLYALA